MCFNSICLIFFLTIGLTLSEESVKCNKENDQTMDRLAMELTAFGDPNGIFPSNQTQMTTQCAKDKESIKWIRAYIDQCLKGVTYDMTSLGVKDMDTVIKKYCDSPKLSKLYISWASCGNSALNDTVKCWENYVLNMERISAEKENIVDKDKVGLICCIYHRFDNCIEESFLRVGNDRCSTSAVEGLHGLLNEISGRTIENFCGDYQADNDKCDSLLIQYKHLNEIKLNKPLNKAPLNAFIQIMNSSPDLVEFRKDIKKEN